jgi:hypothetical protein
VAPVAIVDAGDPNKETELKSTITVFLGGGLVGSIARIL